MRIDPTGALLAVHVVAGCAGLLAGPVAALAPKRPGRHTRAGIAYLVAVAAMSATAVGLVAGDPARLWGLGVVAVGTAGAAATGWALPRRRHRGWLPWHVRLMGGSYISLVTAALVVSWASPLAWVAPTLVGSPMIALAVHRVTGPGPHRRKGSAGDRAGDAVTAPVAAARRAG